MSNAEHGTILVTGAAGFIGFHAASRLLQEGFTVAGVDSLNDYYDPRLKRARLEQLAMSTDFAFRHLDLADRAATEALFADLRPSHVLHLAAQPGVRYSIDHPHAYHDGNATAFLNVLEGCRHAGTAHLTYASSSSVYGNNPKTPYRVGDPVDRPISLYAATKRANELTAYAYSHLFGLTVTGLRFFTVYGPWGRPDMAVFLFTEAIKAGRPINVFNHGDMRRDFTYVDDIVEATCRVLLSPQAPARADNGGEGETPYRLYNIGNNRPEVLGDLIAALEDLIGRRAVRRECDMQPGDVHQTFADTGPLERDFGFRPSTPLREGLKRFLLWHDAYAGNG
ncbi:MAG: NAD-dependent epimerase/dehydratase family protein [Rhizobiaceae bacterium]